MKIYLDDVRDLPSEYVAEGGWTVVRHPDDLIALYETLPDIEVISFDHDLGEPPTKTGYDVLNWIESYTVANMMCWAPEFRIHSANPVGRKNMEAAIRSIYRMVTRNTN